MNRQGETPGTTHSFWQRLWVELDLHEVEPGVLGEYASVIVSEGPEAAARAFPEVARHLSTGCPRCGQDLAELRAMIAGEALESQRGAGARLGTLETQLELLATQLASVQRSMTEAVEEIRDRFHSIEQALRRGSEPPLLRSLQQEIEGLRSELNRSMSGMAAFSIAPRMAIRDPGSYPSRDVFTFRIRSDPDVELKVVPLAALTLGQLSRATPRQRPRPLAGWEVILHPRVGSAPRGPAVAVTDDRGLAFFEPIDPNELEGATADARPPR